MRGPQTAGITEELLRKLYVDDPDASLESAAKKVGVNRETFRRWVKQFGLPLKEKARPGKMKGDHDQRISDKNWLAEQLETKTAKDVAAEIGVDDQVISYWARKFGIFDEDKSTVIKSALNKKYPDGRFGDQASNWKGGRHKTKDGYIEVYAPDHPYARNGKVFEHRLVMEKMLGRYLKPDEIVHHLDGVKDRNDPSNLEVKHRGQHVSEHFKASHEVLSQRSRVEELELENAELKHKLSELESQLTQ